jgi:hypothetical protein
MSDVQPPHLLDNRLTDGGEVVSLTCRAPFTPRKIHGTHFCSQGHSAAGWIGSTEKSFEWYIRIKISLIPRASDNLSGQAFSSFHLSKESSRCQQ